MKWTILAAVQAHEEGDQSADLDLLELGQAVGGQPGLEDRPALGKDAEAFGTQFLVFSSCCGGTAATARLVLNPPLRTRWVTQTGTPVTGVRLPMVRMPSMTCCHCATRSRAALRVVSSGWVAAVWAALSC